MRGQENEALAGKRQREGQNKRVAGSEKEEKDKGNSEAEKLCFRLVPLNCEGPSRLVPLRMSMTQLQLLAHVV